MNWGHGLVVVFAGFATLIGTLVYKATHTKYELVSKDYYGDEIRYQEKIDGINNAVVAGGLQVSKEGKTIRLTLPQGLHANADSADAWFYCQTNAASDKMIRIGFSDGSSIINAADFAATAYELKLQFAIDHKTYYYTQRIDLR